MTALSLIAALAAFALFGLATDAHALARLHVRPSRVVRRRRQGAAWLLLGVSFAAAVAGRGWAYGPVVWTGAIMFAAGIVFLALNLLPRKAGR